MRELTEAMLAGLVCGLFDTPPLERHGAALSFQRPFARKDFYTLVKDTAGVDLARTTEPELRALLQRRGVAEAEQLNGAKLVDEVFKTFAEPTLVQPTFVLDYPVALSPLAKRKRHDPNHVELCAHSVLRRDLPHTSTPL